MTMRIAILAACAGTLALALADVARANYSVASESKTLVRNADVGPEPVIVIAAPVNTSRSNKKAGVATSDPIPGVDIVVKPGGGLAKKPNAGSGRTKGTQGLCPRPAARICPRPISGKRPAYELVRGRSSRPLPDSLPLRANPGSRRLAGRLPASFRFDGLRLTQ